MIRRRWVSAGLGMPAGPSGLLSNLPRWVSGKTTQASIPPRLSGGFKFALTPGLRGALFFE